MIGMYRPLGVIKRGCFTEWHFCSCGVGLIKKVSCLLPFLHWNLFGQEKAGVVIVSTLLINHTKILWTMGRPFCFLSAYAIRLSLLEQNTRHVSIIHVHLVDNKKENLRTSFSTWSRRFNCFEFLEVLVLQSAILIRNCTKHLVVDHNSNTEYFEKLVSNCFYSCWSNKFKPYSNNDSSVKNFKKV